jgi:hypothetical protein
VVVQRVRPASGQQSRRPVDLHLQICGSFDPAAPGNRIQISVVEVGCGTVGLSLHKVCLSDFLTVARRARA